MKQNIRILFLALALVIVIIPIIIYCITLRAEEFAESSGDFGIFGDYIGGTVGTVVGIISVFLLYETYTSQVRFARKQDAVAKLQQFETTFFNLLEQQQMLSEQLG